MVEIDDADVEEYITQITKSQPGWIRLVVWTGRLAQPDGSPAGSSTTVHRIVVHDGTAPRAEYGSTMDAYDAFRRIELALDDVDWSELRLVADRDGRRDLAVLTDQPLRPEEDSGSDPYWDQVHDYLELNRAEVDELAERLRGSGDLPGGSSAERGRGVLGYFRRDG